MRRGKPGAWWSAAWPGGLSLLVVLPLLAPGYVLVYDMVFTPRQYLMPDSLGLSDVLPRAVPADAIVALLTRLVPGQLVQKSVLLLALGLAGIGVARLSRLPGWGGALAGGLAVWNAYVAERLLLGHWTLLLAYGCLPWLLMALADLRQSRPGALARTWLWMAGCALSPQAAAVAGLVVLAFMAWPAGRAPGTLRHTVAALIVVNLPWLLPGAFQASGGRADAAGLSAFAPRAELPGAGALGSLLGLGGIWNAEVVPVSRTLATATAGTVLVVALAVYGLRGWLSASPATGPGLVLAAGCGFGIAVLGVLATRWSALSDALVVIPGSGLLRDSQKFLAPLALLESVTFAHGVVRLGSRLSRRARGWLLTAGLALPVLLMPDLALGAAGRLAPATYPSDWNRVRAVLSGRAGHGDLVSLPWQPFRRFGWNEHRTQLDPGPRYLPVGVVVPDDLSVAGVTVADGDKRADEITRALAGPADYAAVLPPLGVGWLLVQHGTPGATADTKRLAGAEVVFRGQWLTLYQLPAAQPAGWPSATPAVVTVDLVVLACVAIAGWNRAMAGRRRRPLLD